MGQVAVFTPPRPEVARNPGSAGPSPAIRTTAVYVVFTTIDETLAAARVADDLAKALAVPLTVTHFRIVPYALQLDRPIGLSPVETDAFVDRVKSEGLDARARVYLCRDARSAIPLAFRGHSLVVVGGRHHWWPTRAERWRRTLEAQGHLVLFVDAVDHKERSHA